MEQVEIQRYGRRYRLVYGMVSLAVISSGAYLSHIRFLDTEWLSRAGCIVVVIGIWSGLGGIIQERIFMGRLRLRYRMAAVRLRRKLRRGGSDAKLIAEQTEALKAEFESQIKVISDQLRLSVGIHEVTLLMIGTLLWGFGDLFLK